ncbi:MAG: type III-B CRISPR-associated protein Cas10/Cmr2 [Anaerolineae bacterium]
MVEPVTQTKAADLLIVSLGPVQSFIVAARRTQDLWMGSQVLSALARAGLNKALALGATPIYPVQIDGGWPESLPNRFVISAPAGRGKDFGEKIAAAINDEWIGAAGTTKSFFTGLAGAEAWQDIWDRQVGEWLEMYWVAWSWDGSDYGTAFRRASLALDGRKQVRHYPASAEPDETCTLCGERQALRNRGEAGNARNFWNAVRQDPRSISVREGEQLCAVCTIKRLAARAGVQIGGRKLAPEEGFPSTSSVAAASFKKALLEKLDEKLDALIAAHLGALDTLKPRRVDAAAVPFLERLADGRPLGERLLQYDGDLFFQETFVEARLADVLGRDPTDEDRHNAVSALDTLRVLLKKTGAEDLKIAPPHPYFAMLALDGDHMGALLGACRSPEQHRKLSQAMARFAQEEVYRIVEREHAGRVVYAGGDDVLAFVPVSDALDVAQALQEAFRAALQPALPPGAEPASASVGVAIAHHIQPLAYALAAARRAERQAKDVIGRDAIVLEVLRRSGEHLRVGAKWRYEAGSAMKDTPKVIDDVREKIALDALSGKLAYDVRAEAPALAAVPDAWETELTRLLKRHWMLKPVEDHRQTITDLAARLAHLSARMTKFEGLERIELLAEWLLLARFLVQGGRE